MFKLFVLACLMAVAMAAPADVVTKSTDSSVVVNKNDPYNPNDDTVVKKQSVSETVAKTDSSYPPGLDKNSMDALTTLSKVYGFNPFNPLMMNPTYMYNPYSAYSPYSMYSMFSSFYPTPFHPTIPSYPTYPSSHPSYPSYPSYTRTY